MARSLVSSFLDRGQLIGYMFAEQLLVITLSDKMALKMKADGWDIEYNEELGYFLHLKQIKLDEVLK